MSASREKRGTSRSTKLELSSTGNVRRVMRDERLIRTQRARMPLRVVNFTVVFLRGGCKRASTLDGYECQNYVRIHYANERPRNYSGLHVIREMPRDVYDIFARALLAESQRVGSSVATLTAKRESTFDRVIARSKAQPPKIPRLRS